MRKCEGGLRRYRFACGEDGGLAGEGGKWTQKRGAVSDAPRFASYIGTLLILVSVSCHSNGAVGVSEPLPQVLHDDARKCGDVRIARVEARHVPEAVI